MAIFAWPIKETDGIRLTKCKYKGVFYVWYSMLMFFFFFFLRGQYAYVTSTKCVWFLKTVQKKYIIIESFTMYTKIIDFSNNSCFPNNFMISWLGVPLQSLVMELSFISVHSYEVLILFFFFFQINKQNWFNLYFFVA